MSWFGGSDSVAELDVKIEEATSESIPNGELDVATALEITDDIRSKKVEPKQSMRCLKKRLTKVYTNANLLSLTLKLCDMCVKNGGSHFLSELNSKEFMDYLVEVIFKVHYDTKDYKVYSSEAKMKIGKQILVLIQEWNAYTLNSGKLSYLDRIYTNLKNQGYEFPPIDPLIRDVAANFVDSEAPPDWIDGKECMICYSPFSVMNRKHHCRACGGVFCQTHSSHSIPLVSLGILLPVRVCDDCNQIHKNSSSKKKPSGHRTSSSGSKPQAEFDNEDEDLKRAIELSLKDTLIQASYAPPSAPPPPATVENDDGMDDDLRAAIKASLEDVKEPVNQPSIVSAPQNEPELDFYQNLTPFDANAYSNTNNAQGYTSYSNASYDRPDTSSSHFEDPRVPAVSEQSKPAQEQLTEQDEDNINLFVQLMQGIKADKFKQANILNDQNLNDLHGKVVRLKPKLNRSLRDAIEKYEYFLEMNNKISSITSLYDQYLESMLQNAYSRHSIAPPQSYNSGPYPIMQEPYSGSASNYATETQQVPNYYPEDSRQLGQCEENVYYSNQYPRASNFQDSERFQNNGIKASGTSTAPYAVTEINPSDMKVNYNRERSDSMYPVDSEAYPNLPTPIEAKVPLAPEPEFNGYPQEPSSPPDDSDIDDAESVSSRFPLLEGQYDLPRAPEENANREHAAMRFPSLNRIEQLNDASKEAVAQPKYKAEPEPLIEL